MKAKIIDGKAVAQQVRDSIRLQAEDFEKNNGRKVGLAVIIVGQDPASQVYVRNKVKGCEQVGFKSMLYALEENTTQQQLEDLISVLDSDPNVDGLLVQVPLPKHLDEKRALSLISKNKDVDGFCAENVGNLVLGNECSKACTPSGIIELIKSTGESISGKNAVVIGRSNTVGKPAAIMLLENNATVTICHSKTQNIKEICKTADILVAAVGKTKFVTEDMVKQGAVVIDVGMNRDENGKLCGDVDFLKVKEKASYITPVPGGVGPMTITMLLENTVRAVEE